MTNDAQSLKLATDVLKFINEYFNDPQTTEDDPIFGMVVALKLLAMSVLNANPQ